MKYDNIVIESAKEEDAASLAAIYAPYVLNTAITFEYEPPSVEEFRSRIRNTMKKYPYLVAKNGGEILGYAYAGTFKDRAAYSHCVETSVYLKKEAQGGGIGKKLYLALEEELKKMGILNLYACIAYPEKDDEYLTKNSACFHEHIGYRPVGEFLKCGYKFGRWYNMVWMEKFIGEHN